MKVAIVHDDLMRRGGAEQVALSMLKAFPDADFYTMCYDPASTYPEYRQYYVRTSWFQYLTKDADGMKKLFFPLGIWAMKTLDVTGYDIVVISTTFAAKYVKISPSSLVFNYTHIPFRLAWNPTSYTQYNNSTGIYKWIFDKVINFLRKSDAEAAKRTDYFLANTTETARRIKEVYGVFDVKVIKPDVKVRNFYLSDKPKEYYLLVSRLESYKKVDLAIEAFNKLGLKLIIVGSGTKAAELKKMAGNSIEFRKGLSAGELAILYANCKAFIFPQHEDYGITPLEANASGRPVIAYGAGGVLETMIPYTNDASKATSIFFYQQTVQAIIGAIEISEKLNFDPKFIREHAGKFDESIFVNELHSFVIEKYNERQTF